MNVHYNIQSVQACLTPSLAPHGIAGFAMCTVDGEFDPLRLEILALPDGQTRIGCVVDLAALAVPACLRDPAIRREIELGIEGVIASSHPPETEAGEVDVGPIGVHVYRNKPDLFSEGIAAFVMVKLKDSAAILPLTLLVDGSKHLHVMWSVSFDRFELPVELMSARVREAIRAAIYEQIKSWPGFAEATRS